MRSEAQRKADKKYRESEKNNYTAISAGMTAKHIRHNKRRGEKENAGEMEASFRLDK